ncbi:hypothetical protein CMV_008269 [Castanea mollissima]|uniref:Uncharacterized protein n=1 Tax=Castanea mollissima TaxID=60419 RepID=A0A8J4VS80_9ROSI|nr:hypothetical protein CMV_008269 [Castanea mollissima]
MLPLELRGHISRMKQKRRGDVCMSQKEKKLKTGDLASWQTASGKEDDQAENAGGKNKCGDESTDMLGKRGSTPDWNHVQVFNSITVYLGISSQFTGARNGTSNKMEPNHPDSGMTLNTRKSRFFFRPFCGRRKSGASNSHFVKLVLDLPLVNLPPSVCVVSQADFKGFQFGASTKISVAGGGICNSGKENLVS